MDYDRNMFLLDFNDSKLYLVDTNLFATGPGKELKSEDHSSIFQELWTQLSALNEDDSKRPKCYKFFLRADNGYLCNFFEFKY